ncbi:Cullin-associated NEDD8-dissociated protein 1 [Coelomomyces lativittatus]|nr:Cullin-associated NEDD8-dissociated protein 1 [Coelomomyces lativittatus]KAJ1516175.1 Cullin-associated NEDD8-dissociated protein 1 [Coelomomyces lativittatus]
MALNDLMSCLVQPSFTLNEHIQQTLMPLIFELMKGPNGSVQNMAIQCLASLATKLDPPHLESLWTHLVDWLNSKHSNTNELQTLASLGLKSVLSAFPNASLGMGPLTLEKKSIPLHFLSSLLEALTTTSELTLHSLMDLIYDGIHQFLLTLVREYPERLIQFHATLVPYLIHPRLRVRKRTSQVVAMLTFYLPNHVYESFLKEIMLLALKDPPHRSLPSLFTSNPSIPTSWLHQPILTHDIERLRLFVDFMHPFLCFTPSSTPHEAPYPSYFTLHRFLSFVPSFIDQTYLWFHPSTSTPPYELLEGLIQCYDALCTASLPGVHPWKAHYIVPLLLTYLKRPPFKTWLLPTLLTSTLTLSETDHTDELMDLPTAFGPYESMDEDAEDEDDEEEEEMLDFSDDDMDDGCERVRHACAKLCSHVFSHASSSSDLSLHHVLLVSDVLISCYQERKNENIICHEFLMKPLLDVVHDLSRHPERAGPWMQRYHLPLIPWFELSSSFIFSSSKTSSILNGSIQPLFLRLLHAYLSLPSPLSFPLDALTLLMECVLFKTSSLSSLLPLVMDLMQVYVQHPRLEEFPDSLQPLFNHVLLVGLKSNDMDTVQCTLKTFQCLATYVSSKVSSFSMNDTHVWRPELEEGFHYLHAQWKLMHPERRRPQDVQVGWALWVVFLQLSPCSPSTFQETWEKSASMFTLALQTFPSSLALQVGTLFLEVLDLPVLPDTWAEHHAITWVERLVDLLQKVEPTEMEIGIRCLHRLLHRFPSTFPIHSILNAFNKNLATYVTPQPLSLTTATFSFLTTLLKTYPTHTQTVCIWLQEPLGQFLTHSTLSSITASSSVVQPLLDFVQQTLNNQQAEFWLSFVKNTIQTSSSVPWLLAKIMAMSISHHPSKQTLLPPLVQSCLDAFTTDRSGSLSMVVEEGEKKKEKGGSILPLCRSFWVYTLGELGTKVDVMGTPAGATVVSHLMRWLEMEDGGGGDVKPSVAWTLGHLTVTQPTLFTTLIDDYQQKKATPSFSSTRYWLVQSLLHAIHASISFHPRSLTVTFFEPLWQCLCTTASPTTFHQVTKNEGGDVDATPLSTLSSSSAIETEDEGTLSLLGECLGHLALACPTEVVPKLKQGCRHVHPFVRRASYLGFKVGLPSHPSWLSECLTTLDHQGMDDVDVHVRRSALTCFLTAAHVYGSDAVAPYVHGVYLNTYVQPSLITKVMLGPFQHVVDQGLDTRLLAYACVSQVFPNVPTLAPVCERILAGFLDVHDIGLMCLRMVAKHPQVFDLTLLVDPFLACLDVSKPSSVKQDLEKAQEKQTGMLKTVATIVHKIPPCAWPPSFAKFHLDLRNGPLATSFRQWCEEVESKSS